MSQRIFQTDQYEIYAGWDKPLQRFFLLIESLNDQNEMTNYVFNNLRLKNPAMSLTQIHDVLNSFQITPPQTFFTDLIADRHNDNMDRYHYP